MKDNPMYHGVTGEAAKRGFTKTMPPNPERSIDPVQNIHAEMDSTMEPDEGFIERQNVYDRI